MMKPLKIFYNENVLVLRPKGIKIDDNPSLPSGVYDEVPFLEHIFSRFVREEAVPEVYYSSEEVFLRASRSVFRRMEAAGGLVTDSAGRVLCIYRLGRWDLPKGKQEEGECLEETAVREVMEECGLQSPPDEMTYLTDTWHIYLLKGRYVLKKTTWFSMYYREDSVLVPQQEEGITKASWLSGSELHAAITSSYASLQDVFRAAGVVNP